MKHTRRAFAGAGITAITTLAIVAAAVAPAAAANSGSLVGSGVETHVGVPTFVPPGVVGPGQPCSTFTSYTYNGVFQMDSTHTGLKVPSTSTSPYTTAHASVYSAPGMVWAEGPEGTYADAGAVPGTSSTSCDGTTTGFTGPGYAVPGFKLQLTASDGNNNTLSCRENQNDSSKSTYARSESVPGSGDGLQVTYTFTDADCTQRTVSGIGLPTTTPRTATLTFVEVIRSGPQPDLPPFDWTTVCTGPIAPAGCVSDGTVTAS
jgi:hypothetical protein